MSLAKKGDEEEDATLKELTSNAKQDEAKGPAEPEKLKEKHIMKMKEKERAAMAAAEREAALKAAQEQEALEGAETSAERAKRLRELQMKQEMELAAAQFGGGSKAASGGPLPSDPTMLLAAVPLSDGDSFIKFGQEVAKRVHEATGTKTILAMKFYNELLNAGSDRLSATELTALIRTLETKERSKREAEKKAAGKGKATKAKGAAKVNLKDDYGKLQGGFLAGTARRVALGAMLCGQRQRLSFSPHR